MEPIIKGLTEELLRKYLGEVNLGEIRNIITKLITKNYEEGLESAEKEFDMNFVKDYESEEFLKNFSFDNVTKLTDDLKDNLRKEVSMALMNREKAMSIRKRIKETLDTTVERAKMIQVTETNRAHNMGKFQGAKESGLDLVKVWDAQPERVSRAGNKVPCVHCEFLDEQSVGLDDKFVDDQGREFFLPPHHPNCACTVRYEQLEK